MNTMTRLRPHQIQDKFYLARLLELYITTLQESPLELRLKGLAYDTGIQESIFRRLMNLYRNPDDAPNINAEDFHILFANIMFRFPTVKMWLTDEGEVVFEM
ncbi:MAG: hypothetical protein KA138_15120 [Saprospiraceae bacterium]|nr:hypothetical protein [Saprospiraceae bacterium]